MGYFCYFYKMYLNFLLLYCDIATNIIDSFYVKYVECLLSDYKDEKTFLGVDRDTLEDYYRDYLKMGFYSDVIELSALMGFVGHEYEGFKYEMVKFEVANKVGLLDVLLNTKRNKVITEDIPKLTSHLKTLYDTVLSPEPPVGIIEKLVQNAMDEKCYINPCVHTIIDRAKENGIKRFKPNSN